MKIPTNTKRKFTKAEVTNYARREYGAKSDQIAALEKATDKRYRQLKRSGKLVAVTVKQLRKLID